MITFLNIFGGKYQLQNQALYITISVLIKIEFSSINLTWNYHDRHAT